MCGMPRWPRIELMLTMIGCRPSFSRGNAERVISSSEKKFSSISRRARCGSALSKSPSAPAPALLTRISSPPRLDRATSKIFCRVAGSVMSPTTVSTGRPVAAISSLNCRSRSSRRAVTRTLAPAWASSRATHRPMPLEAPVTITRRRYNSRFIVVFGVNGKRVCHCLEQAVLGGA